jgi:hypothetical protein
LIFADPKMPPRDKERLIRAFAAAIGDLVDYIPGPDLGTDEAAMGWIKDETGRAVGLPREIGGTRSMRSAHRLWPRRGDRRGAAAYRVAAGGCPSGDPGLRLGR